MHIKTPRLEKSETTSRWKNFKILLSTGHFLTAKTKINKIHTSYERLEKPLEREDSWRFLILSCLILYSETIFVFLMLNFIDLYLAFGYIHQTKYFMMSKYLLWIPFIFIAFCRYIYGLKRYPKVYDFLITKKAISFSAIAIVFMTYTSVVTNFTSGICLASHSSTLEGWSIMNFMMSTGYMRQFYDSTCNSDTFP